MMQAGMHGTGIYQMGHSHLVDTPETLVIGMGDDAEDQLIIDSYESVYRIVDDFPKAHVAWLHFLEPVAPYRPLLKVLQSKRIEDSHKVKN
jgi:hypothetical protein